MARKQEPLTFAGALEVQAQKPLDGRRKVALIADLTEAASFPYIFSGLDVYCEENQKWYTFLGGDQTDINNWRMEGSGGGGGSTDWNDITNKPTDLVQDASYVHTDNNYTTSDKDKLASLENYDDTALSDRVGANETAIANRYTKSQTDALIEAEHVELTQAEYDALTPEQKNNGTVYFITDGGTYVPAIDMIPYVNQAPIVVGKFDLRGDGEYRDIKRVRLWISDLKNCSTIITVGWPETGVYIRTLHVYGAFTLHKTISGEERIYQYPIPYTAVGYDGAIQFSLNFYVNHQNKLIMDIPFKQSVFHQDDFAQVIIDYIETPAT